MLIFLFLIIPTLNAEVAKNTKEQKISINKKHLAEDLLDLYGMFSNIFSEKEMDFQYFATHDFDENEKLDGLELFNAFSHELRIEAEEMGTEYSDKDTENEVDAILSEYDVNNDGFLDYTEFERAQKVHDEPDTESNSSETPTLDKSE